MNTEAHLTHLLDGTLERLFGVGAASARAEDRLRSALHRGDNDAADAARSGIATLSAERDSINAAIHDIAARFASRRPA